MAPPADAAGPRLEGPELPAPGALPGRIFAVDRAGCRLHAVELDSVVVAEPGTATGCAAWVSPEGTRAVVALERAGREGARIGLLELGAARRVEPLGRASGHVAWAPDGSAVAWCGPDDTSTVRSLADGGERAVAGCDPRLLADGTVLTRPSGFLDRRILEEGATLLDSGDLASMLPADAASPVTVLGYDVFGSRLAVALVAAGREDVVQALVVFDGGVPRPAIELVRAPTEVMRLVGDFGLAGKVVRLSPTGREVAVGPPRGGGSLLLFDLETGQATRLPEQTAFDWSPDGTWLALAVRGRTLVFGPDRSTYSYALPIEASLLAWRP